MTASVFDNMVALLDGKTITLDGKTWRMNPDKSHGSMLEAGDVYWAGKKTQSILTVRGTDQRNHWVFPVEMAYSYDFADCIGVEQVK